MEELVIYEYQAKAIEEALRVVSRLHKSEKKDTCMNRDITYALNTIRNVIDKNPQRTVERS